MKAVDTNVLVFAEIRQMEQNRTALKILREMVEGQAAWALPWPCVYEFLRVVTHPKVFHPPVPFNKAYEDLRSILGSPALVLLSETPRHKEVLDMIAKQVPLKGNLVHDAHIAALCLEDGVSEIITGDTDFLKFPEMKVTNPFA